MRTKYLGLVHLPIDLYQQLEARALAEERDPLQQARWLLRLALTGDDSPQPGADDAAHPRTRPEAVR